MLKEEVLRVVTHTGDCYRIKCHGTAETLNFYVSRVGSYGLEQDASDLPYGFVSYHSIEWVERY
jgi:hypothetical protein